jgi:membrane-bound ClpP family serine protease
MFAPSLVLAVLFVIVLVVAALAFVAALSRHKKGAASQLNLVGAKASVEQSLDPQGSVLVGGELWPACSHTGAAIERGRTVRVVGASGHMLLVEAVE